MLSAPQASSVLFGSSRLALHTAAAQPRGQSAGRHPTHGRPSAILRLRESRKPGGPLNTCRSDEGAAPQSGGVRVNTSLPRKIVAILIALGVTLLLISSYLEGHDLDVLQGHPIWANLLSGAIGFCFGLPVLSVLIGRALERSRASVEAKDLAVASATTEQSLQALLESRPTTLQYLGFSDETWSAFDLLRLHCRIEGGRARHAALTIHRVDQWFTAIEGPRRKVGKSFEHHDGLGGFANDIVALRLESVLRALADVEALLWRARVVPTAPNATALLAATARAVIEFDRLAQPDQRP
jgi:hypothetical protein